MEFLVDRDSRIPVVADGVDDTVAARRSADTDDRAEPPGQQDGKRHQRHDEPETGDGGRAHIDRASCEVEASVRRGDGDEDAGVARRDGLDRDLQLVQARLEGQSQLLAIGKRNFSLVIRTMTFIRVSGCFGSRSEALPCESPG